MPKPILFCDFDGVLCHDRFWRSLPAHEHAKVQEYLFGNDTELVNDWMRGRYSAEEITQKVARYTGIPFERLWDVFVNDCRTMAVSREALETLHRLRDKYTVLLVTSNMDSFGRFTRPAAGLDRYFDCISSSFEEGSLKTDAQGAIYRKLALRHEVPIKDCCLLDDSKETCRIFSDLGGTAHLVTKEEDIIFHLKKIRGI